MAQTSSAAREPSMEEILASIRRIIEDSDVVRQPLAVPVKTVAKGEVAEFPRAVSPVSFAQDPVDEPEVDDEPDDFTSFHSDVANDADEVVNPYIDRLAALKHDTPNEDYEVADAASSVETKFEYTHISETVIEEAQSSTPIDEPSVSSLEDQSVEAPLEPVAAQHEYDAESVLAGSENDVGGSMASSTRSILSEATERQVASAFKDLNQAVHSEPLRSFDDIATDLLQPMLAEWMDKNLPSLVERLVREEITRIVRGEK